MALSPTMFLILVSAAAIPNLVIRRAHHWAFKTWDAERTAFDELQKQYSALIDGAKELRINRQRRLRFRDDGLFRVINRLRDLSGKAASVFAAAEAIDSAGIFIVIGLLIAAQGQLGNTQATLSAFAVTLLYMKGPLNYAIGYMPMFSRATVSFHRIIELSSDFATLEPTLLDESAGPVDPIVDTIELRQAQYAYPQIGDAPIFVLGPIDLLINRGETLFIVGENGSGKTTLLKLILGLYEPTRGAILLNRKAVTRQSRDDYRQHFSAVFFDYYLFDDIIVPDDETAASVADYLERMELAHKVRIENGAFSTIKLSVGQRKRLALISAYAERRPVMAFDEWAAEQDPSFRRVFYHKILPDLKRQGKTLIVVSHDDRYFDVADRIVDIRDGRISVRASG
jgi:putative ATP-binding cassette transporter